MTEADERTDGLDETADPIAASTEPYQYPKTADRHCKDHGLKFGKERKLSMTGLRKILWKRVRD